MDVTYRIMIGIMNKSYPEFIYKYRFDNEHSEKILTNKELWFSDPNEFNDPYDCSTPINKNTSLDDIKKWLNKVGVNVDVDIIAEKLKSDPDLMEVETRRALKEIGVCCFSTLNDSILQWSHYADYHKGICFKFEMAEDLNFCAVPIIVSYRRFMPHYNHYTQRDRIVEYLIQPKYHEWSYESEIRIVKTKDKIASNKSGRAFAFKANFLKEMIFGAKTPDKVKHKYINLCKNQNFSHVKFSQARLGNGPHYGIDIIQI